jgi:hypothetical protein
LWRNDSLQSIPLTNNWDSIKTGWFKLPISINKYITAISVCKTPSNRVYFGTHLKQIYRIDNAHTSNPTLTGITSSLFSSSGYVSCIAVDPNNGDNVMVAFSNYNIYSLFYSNDAGVTWTKVAGNLEEFSNGSGNGPSIRWASIVPTVNGNVYLVGTSVGLYGTNHLNGLSTVWSNLSPNEIGYMVVDMMDYRTSDGLVAIGTHGNGIFSTYLTDTLTATSTINPFDLKINTYPNPVVSFVDISFAMMSSGQTVLEVFDSRGQLVTTLENKFLTRGNYRYRLERKDLSTGVYYIRIQTGDNKSLTKKVLFIN